MAAEIKGIPVNFRDEMMTVIALVLEAAELTPEEFGKRINEPRIINMNKQIMEVFLSLHRKGMQDAKTLFEQGRKL